jgi:hypothetical protein
MIAERETLAASGAEDRKHGAQDALACLANARACLAEQGMARWQARQGRGRFSGRRRWQFAARPPGKCPRIGKFHNAIQHSHGLAPAPQHSGARLSVLTSFARLLARALRLRPGTARLSNPSTIIGQVVENHTFRLCRHWADAILRSSQGGFDFQSIGTICAWANRQES